MTPENATEMVIDTFCDSYISLFLSSVFFQINNTISEDFFPLGKKIYILYHL